MANVESESDFTSKKNSSGWQKFTTAKRMIFLLVIFGFLICVVVLIGLGIMVMVNYDNVRNKTVFGKIQKREILLDVFAEVPTDGLKKANTTSSKIVCDEVCISPSCQNEANFFLKNMNQDINPCDDFHQFVCENFIKHAVIPGDNDSTDMLSNVQSEVNAKIQNTISEEIKIDELKTFKKLKIFYQNCMNESLVQEESTNIFLDILNHVGGWPVLLDDKWKEDNYIWTEPIYKLYSRGYALQFPVLNFVQIDSKNTTRHVINILGARTRISRMYLLDGVDSKIMKAYYDYMVNIAVMMGANRDVALRDMKECLEFELNIYNLKSSPEELQNRTATFNPMSLREISLKCPSVPWLKLFNEILKLADIHIDENEVIIVRDLKYLAGLEGLIKRTPSRVIANYLLWQFVYNFVDYLPDAFLDRQLDFMTVVSGVTERPSRAVTCVDEIMIGFPVAVSALYVRKYVDERLRESVLELAGNVKSQFRRMLEEVDWMDEETRKAALEKIDAMNIFIGYADELFDDQKINDYHKDLEIHYGSYLNSALNASLFFEKRYYENLKKPANKNDWTWKMVATDVNAQYIAAANTIQVSAAFLQRPFFRFEGPQYLNYGAIGSIIGHEITHGFDSEGRKSDKNGNQIDWWKEATKQKYLEKEKCMIEQYNNYIVPEINLSINGNLTKNENIADNGGLKTAYRAYNEWASRAGAVREHRLPGLNYTARQMFWISAATNWCGRFRVEDLRSRISGDSHSTYDARVIVPLTNIREFAEDFACKPGSRMNPVNKCVVW